VGFAPVAGLAANVSDWYSYSWSIPSNAVAGSYTYWAQVWAEGKAISGWSSKQDFPVTCGGGISAQVISLWSVSGAQCGHSSTLWAQVKNTGSSGLPSNAKVWYWVTGPSWSGTHWVGSASVAGLAVNVSKWYSYNWVIPAAATGGTYSYWAQVWGSGKAISGWSSKQDFNVICH